MTIGFIIRTGLIALVGVGVLGADLGGGMRLRAHAQERQAAKQTQAQPENPEQYMRRNEGRFEEWGRKIDSFNAKAAERGQQAKERTKRELDEAWSEVKTGWSRLKGVSKEGWGDAKDALETGWRKLERAWKDADS